MDTKLVVTPAPQQALEKPAQSGGGFMEVHGQRAAQEVQAAVTVAKRFPRDTTAAFTRIIESCKRKSLAEAGVYAYPRGGETVSGPSIRLAEVLAQNYGNLDFGIRQLSSSFGESTMEAYCWDMETNVRQTRIFAVPHERKTKRETKVLDDPRDIYELTANMGARRLRACILGIIPGDIVDAALDQCEQTMRGGSEPLEDRVRSMVVAFKELGVPQAAIEKRLGHKLESVIEAELVQLKKVYRSLKDGFSKREDYFELPTKGDEIAAKVGSPKPTSAASQVAAQINAGATALPSDPGEFDNFSGTLGGGP